MAKNLCGKTRPKDNPYEIWEGVGQFEGWTWRVLKKWQTPDKEVNNPYARWFCFVTSPFCPDGEYGDTYINDILPGSRQVKGEPSLKVAMREGGGHDTLRI